MTNVQKKVKRPRVGSTLCLTYQDIMTISGPDIEVQVSIEPKPSFSPGNYFRILKEQADHKFKFADTERALYKSLDYRARRVNMMRLMRDAYKLNQELGSVLFNPKTVTL